MVVNFPSLAAANTGDMKWKSSLPAVLRRRRHLRVPPPRAACARTTPSALDPSSGPPPALALTPEDRAVAAYVGLAIGDALGATKNSHAPRDPAPARRPSGHQRRWLAAPQAGRSPDDTLHVPGLGEAILAAGRWMPAPPPTPSDAWMRAKPADIGNTVRRNLITYRKTSGRGAALRAHDAGNGAAMRVLPVAGHLRPGSPT